MTHVEIRHAAASDTGRNRDANEDSVYSSARLFAVADGMGGHVHGEVASQEAVAAVAELDERLPTELDGHDLCAELASGVSAACDRLVGMAAQRPDLHGMGTTLTAILWDGERFALAHVGDSRGYRLRGGELTQLTRDHTLVQSLVDEGQMSPEQALTHPRRSMLTRAVQTNNAVEPDLTDYLAEVGDRYLLCSDGLTDVLDAESLREVLATVDDPDTLVRELIDLANHGGGPDNITCVVVDVHSRKENHADGDSGGEADTTASVARE